MALSFSLRKVGLIAATAVTLGVGAMAGATSASAWPYGPYGPRPYWGPRPGPVFFGGPPPYYGPPPFYGPRCVVRARWVPGPWGWHKVARRICY